MGQLVSLPSFAFPHFLTGVSPKISVDIKNIHNLKAESYVLFIGSVWTSSREKASQVSLRDLLRGGKEGSQVIYIKRSFATKGRQSECQKVVVV